MWVVIKFDKKKLGLLKNELQERLQKNCILYTPKYLSQNYSNNKLIKKENNLLGDYLFCFNKNFANVNFLRQLNYIRGVKSILDGYESAQKDIKNFINYCKSLEDQQGFLNDNFSELKVNNTYKFITGPFTQKLFKLIEIEKNRIKIKIGNLFTSVKRNNYLIG